MLAAKPFIVITRNAKLGIRHKETSMPYLILAIGLLLGLYALYKFFINADVKQVKAFFLSVLAIAICVALIIMALTGRLVPALVIFITLLPFVAKYVHLRKQEQTASPGSGVMTQKEALEVLNLKDGASPEDIQSAYKKLMMKVHPDTEGSEWMAAKLNQARDILLPK